MDKTLNRVIGYIKPKAQPEVKPAIKKSIIEEAIPYVESASKAMFKMQDMIENEKNKPIKIVTWLKDHPYFKWGAMCRDLGIDKGNFQRVLKSDLPNIKPELIVKIEAVLRNYGF